MSKEKELVCLCNTPFIAGAETAVITDAKGFAEGDISEVFIDDPWFGVIPLTVASYVAGTYPTFNTWLQIMFDADRSHFRCGTPLWFGKIMAYIIPVGARVLTS